MSNDSITPTKNINEVTRQLLGTLDTRSRDIIERRYGLTSGQSETLEHIGKEYGITRERVRQIESHAVGVLRELKEILEPVADLYDEIFRSRGGILAEDHVIELVRAKSSHSQTSNTIRFYLEILPAFALVTPGGVFASHWQYKGRVYPHAEATVRAAQDILTKKRHPSTESTLTTRIRQEVNASPESLPDEYVTAILRASKGVAKSVFGEWGLTGWAEISPRGVGDKAYAVMRRNNKPEHFRKITELINQAKFDTKRANTQTVHNELIKDERFVLVGRGLYGLKEWGYVPGTVGDVLEALLKKAEEPLTKDELIEQVLKQRVVKRNTILLGLQNNKRFLKTRENRYTLRQ